jgi:UTP--glucose-1-phosphate uridylyltransferase
VIATLMNLEQVDAYYMKGKSHDCGSKLGYMKANVEYALRNKELGPEYKAYLKSLSL